jgi:sterol desaturase/sphingolipid hydroxylase (fatty acid hydroxylase superfamily)
MGGTLWLEPARDHRRSADGNTRNEAQPECMNLPPPLAANRIDGPLEWAEPTNARRRSRWRSWGEVAVAGTISAGALLVDKSGLAVVVVLLILVVPFERLFPRHRQRMRRSGLGTDITYGIAGPALRFATTVVGVVIGVGSLAWVPGLLVRPLVVAIPMPARIAMGAVVLDALTYWLHRLSHEVAFLWRFHQVHHSSSQMDWVSGLRVHPLDGAFVAPPIVFLLAAGLPLKVTGALALIQLAIGLFLHANVRWRWRPVQRIVATPEFHHWHHVNEPDALNHNYASFLPIWDLVFGTWFLPEDRRPEKYGIDGPMPEGLLAQLRQPWIGLPNPIRLFVGLLRHPVRTARTTAAAVRRGLQQIAASVRRPDLSVHS